MAELWNSQDVDVSTYWRANDSCFAAAIGFLVRIKPTLLEDTVSENLLHFAVVASETLFYIENPNKNFTHTTLSMS